jgi:hypothetical protein
MGGATAAGAGTAGAYEYSKHHDDKYDKNAEKEHKKMVKEEEKQEKEHQKVVAKEEKEQRKEHEKAVKEDEKREKYHEKNNDRKTDSDDKGKSKGGLLGLLKGGKESKEHEADEHHEHRDAHDDGKHREMNKLRKDPPPGVGYSVDPASPSYADRPVMEHGHPGNSSHHHTSPRSGHHDNDSHHPGAGGMAAGIVRSPEHGHHDHAGSTETDYPAGTHHDQGFMGQSSSGQHPSGHAQPASVDTIRGDNRDKGYTSQTQSNNDPTNRTHGHSQTPVSGAGAYNTPHGAR